MRHVYIASLLVSLSLFPFSPALAAIQSADWQSPADGLLTQDTVSGLEFLDITETSGLSFSFVVSELGIGGQFEGFRVATRAELEALAANAGILPGNLVPNYGPVQSLLTLLGCNSSCGAGDDDAFGRDATSTSVGTHDLWSFQLVPQNPSACSCYGGAVPDDLAQSDFGTWLVRDFAPVPTETTTWGSIKKLNR